MHRLLLASLSLLAACSAPARAPATNQLATTRYTLVPLDRGGGEGRHSMTQSSTHITGTLDVTGATATLTLAYDTFIGHVRCPEEFRGHTITLPSQQCAPPEMKDSRHASTSTLTGTARTERGALIVDVKDKARAMALSCRESYLGLQCAITQTTLFGGPGDVPHSLAFVSPGRKVFGTRPTRIDEIGNVVGTLAIENDKVQLVLGIEGDKMNVLPGTFVHYDHGIVVRAETAPTRNVTAICKPDGDRLVCEMSGDRSVLGAAEHISGEMVFVPSQQLVPGDREIREPAQRAPMQASR